MPFDPERKAQARATELERIRRGRARDASPKRYEDQVTRKVMPAAGKGQLATSEKAAQQLKPAHGVDMPASPLVYAGCGAIRR